MGLFKPRRTDSMNVMGTTPSPRHHPFSGAATVRERFAPSVIRSLTVAALPAVALLLNLAAAPAAAEEKFLDVIRGGQSAATIVVPDGDRGPQPQDLAVGGSTPLWAEAATMITDAAQRWGGSAPQVVRLAADAALPPGNVIVIGMPETSRLIAQRSQVAESPLSRVPLMDPQGFAVEPLVADGRRQLLIAGRTPRGAYNGAVWCRDFLLDATAGEPGKADVFMREGSVIRSPQMAARGTYHLSMYGTAMHYTAEDWMKIIDRYAEDGMNRVCFWLSGHHPSEKYPKLFDVDATSGTKLTVDGVTRLIRHCRDRGIQFYISGGVFAWTASHYLVSYYPDAQAVKAGGLCPSHPDARRGNMDHFLEMYDTWPEADGFMFEVRDEQGECMCERCQVQIDAHGSREYGRAEITWLQEFAREAWKRNPNLGFLWLIGYVEHKDDVYYYDQIRLMNDPRFEWLDVRVGLDGQGKWELPGPNGEPRPLSFFSRRISHWNPFYRHRVEHLIHWANRITNEGLYGFIPAFEPGFGSGSYYGYEIPYPVDRLPYTLTGFVYRELTWEPATPLEALKSAIHRRYFSSDAPRELVDDMLYLQTFSFEHFQDLNAFGQTRYGYSGEEHPALTVSGELKRVQSIEDQEERRNASQPVLARFNKLAGVQQELERMAEIKARMDKAAAKATPKTQEGLALMQRLIDDTREIYSQAVPDQAALTAAVTALQ